MHALKTEVEDKWHVLTTDHSGFNPQRITALWPVLISHSTEGRRLSWCGWLVNTQMVCLPEYGHSSRYQPTDIATAGFSIRNVLV